MRTNTFWKSLLMSAAVLVSGAIISCDKDEEPTDFNAQISTSISAKSVEPGEEVNFTVTSNTKWSASIDDPNGILELSKTAGGSGETAVKATISENAADGNKAVVSFTAMGYAFGYEIPTTVKVTFGVGSLTPALGSGTLEDPLTVAGANAKAKELASGETSAESYFIKGVVTSVKEAYTTQYGNGTFYIGETQDASETFYIYRAYYLDNKKYSSESDPNIEVGDEVVIYGKICNFNGTLETAQNGAYLYMLNGVGGGEVPSEDPVEITPGEYYMFGKLESDSNGASLTPYIYHAWDGTINTSGTSSYLTTVSYSSDDEKTFSLNPANSGSAAKVEIATVSGKEGVYTIKCNGQYLYTTEASKNHTLALGDDASKAEWTFKEYSKGGVVATNNGNTLGTGSATRNFLRSYANETQPTFGLLFCKVSETTLDGEGGGNQGGGETGEIKHEGTLEDPYTVADAITKCQEVGDTQSAESYYIKGVIKSLVDNFGNNTYGNGTFYIKDADADNEFYAYRIYYLDNKQWVTGNSIPAIGDEVVIYGKITNFKGNTPETVQGSAYLYSLNGKTTDEGGNQGGGDESGDDANMITRIADLKAGTYYLAGYSESYSTTTYAPYSYHAWTGTISSNGDLNTVNYQYDATAKSLTLNPNLSSQDAAKGTAVKVELISAGENAYYIKYNNQYLCSTEADTNRKMGLTDTATAWTFSNHDKGGLSILSNGVILGTGGATYDLLRSYKTPANSLVYGIALIAESVTVNNNGDGGNTGGGTTDPDPDPGNGSTATFDVTNLYAGEANGTSVDGKTYTVDGITFTFNKGTGSTNPSWYANGGEIRVYHNGNLTIAGATITKIEITSTASDGNVMTATPGTLDGSTWTGSASSVEFAIGPKSNGNNGGHHKIKKVVVTYTK